DPQPKQVEVERPEIEEQDAARNYTWRGCRSAGNDRGDRLGLDRGCRQSLRAALDRGSRRMLSALAQIDREAGCEYVLYVADAATARIAERAIHEAISDQLAVVLGEADYVECSSECSTILDGT